jgi:hypothetical protein
MLLLNYLIEKLIYWLSINSIKSLNSDSFE